MKTHFFRFISCFLLLLLSFALLGLSLTASAEEGEIEVTGRDGRFFAAVGGEEKSEERLEDLLAEMPDGSRVLLCNLTENEKMNIGKKKLTLSGKLTLTSDAVSTFSGGEILFEGLELSLASSIRLRDGMLTVINSVITSPSTAILLDKIGAGTFSLESGSISCTGKEPALALQYGSAVLSGGSLTSAGEYAVCNSSVLRLSRDCALSPALQTDVPIFLLPSKEVLPLCVYACMSFLDGEMTPAFFDAEEGLLKNLSLYDGEKTEQELRFVASSDRLCEDNTGSVCKPYILSYYDENGYYSGAEIYNEEKVILPSAPEKAGYTFIGWFAPSASFPLSAGDEVKSSLNLTAEYALAEPSFAISSLAFSFDGTVHSVDFRSLSHPLEEEGIYSFAWLDAGGEVVGSSRALYLRNVSDSGQYRCEITFLCRGDSVTVSTPSVTVSVLPKTVALPSLPTLVYNGSLQTASLLSTAFYTVNDAGGIHAGLHEVTLTLCDAENFAFPDGSSPEKTLYYEILPAENRFVSSPSLPDFYEGQAPSPSAASAFGTPRFLYAATLDGGFAEQAPTEAGEYYLRAYVDATADYGGLLSEPVAFRVLSEVAVGLRVLTPPTKTVYTAFDGFNSLGMSLLLTYTSGRTESPSPALLSVRYANGTSFRVKDSCVYLSYAGLTCVQAVTVTPAAYDLSGLTFSDGEVIFDGTEHTLAYSGQLPTGKDGKTLTCEIRGGGTHVGSYPVSLVFSGGSEDYLLPSPLSATLTVKPLAVDILYADLLFTYDGTPKLPTASCKLPDGTEFAIALTGSAFRAGIYTASAVENPDFSYNNPTVDFTVARASYDLSAVRWEGGGYTYDGSLKSVRITDLPAGVSVVGYADADASEAGVYSATAAFSYDSQNYLPPVAPSYVWRVEKADYDLSGFSVSDATYSFDGNPHCPNTVGQIAPGFDGSKPTYSFGKGAVHAGKGQAVVLTFVTESKNYNTPAPMEAYVDILPAVCAVSWSNLVFTYDGNAHLPSAFSPAFSVTVSGEATHAGKYTARAVSDNPDYEIENATSVFIIEKAENGWIVLPNCPDLYEGKSYMPVGEAISGETVFSYFTDAECQNKVLGAPTPGTYYFVASVKEGEDYLGLCSAPIAFAVIKVVPVMLSVDALREDFVAFETVGWEDIAVTLHLNSGDSLRLFADEYTVEYPSGESLRFGDGEVKITARDFTVSQKVNVSRAKFDVSAVNYVGLFTIFTGDLQSPMLFGLPEGVSLAAPLPSYAEAGSYSFTPVLSYDAINFEEPILSEQIFVISPATVEIPTAESLIYSGGEVIPGGLISPLYTCTLSGIHAGLHEAVLELIDSRNYIFSDGSASTKVGYEILPRELILAVSPVTVYLFETNPEIEWSVASGEVVEGDDAQIVLSVFGNTVVGEAKNRDYAIVLPQTEVVRSRKLSPSVETAVWILVGVILFVSISLFFFLRNFDAVSRFIAGRDYCKEVKRKRRLGILSTENDLEELKKMISVGEKEEKQLPPELPFEEPAPRREEQAAEEQAEEKSDCDLPKPVLQTDFAAELTPPVSKPGFFSDFRDDPPEEMTPREICLPSPLLSVDVFHAESLLSDSAAKVMVERGNERIYSGGHRRGIVNVDSLGNAFSAGDRVDINGMKAKGLVLQDVLNVKVLARGKLDKPLTVIAADFSPSAVKMILLTGGHAVRISSTPKTPLQGEGES